MPTPKFEESMIGFSWIIPQRLAGMPLPGTKRLIERDLSFLKQAGITWVFTLTEKLPDEAQLARYGIRSQHFPVRDFHVPTLEQLTAFVTAVDAALSRNEAVAVHCFAGLGRTGTFLAAYLVWQGASAKQAIAEVRRQRPGSIENKAQQRAVEHFEQERERLKRAQEKGPEK